MHIKSMHMLLRIKVSHVSHYLHYFFKCPTNYRRRLKKMMGHTPWYKGKKNFEAKKKIIIKKEKKNYQGRKHFFGCPARNRESSMSTCVTCRQGFTKVICRLLAGSSQLGWKVGLLLFLLHVEDMKRDKKIVKRKDTMDDKDIIAVYRT